jgi:hypothetical protein
LDEGKRIVDAPINPRSQRGDVVPNDRVAKPLTEQSGSESGEEAEEEDREASVTEPGDYLISFGRKYKGKRLKDVPKAEIEGYIKWLESSADKQGAPVSRQVQFLKQAFTRLYESEKASH